MGLGGPVSLGGIQSVRLNSINQFRWVVVLKNQAHIDSLRTSPVINVDAIITVRMVLQWQFNLLSFNF